MNCDLDCICGSSWPGCHDTEDAMWDDELGGVGEVFLKFCGVFLIECLYLRWGECGSDATHCPHSASVG